MNVNEVITKLRVMLGAQEEVVTEVPKEEVKMASATLVDGTEVYTDGDMTVGATLYVKVEEGEAPFAPAAMHETTDGLLITVGENGEILSIEEKAPAAPAEEVAMEEEVTVEVPEEAAPEVEAIVEAIAELIQPQTEVIEQLKEELEALKSKFSAFAEEPAGQPVKNTFSKERDNLKSLAESRLENLIAIRKGNK